MPRPATNGLPGIHTDQLRLHELDARIEALTIARRAAKTARNYLGVRLFQQLLDATWTMRAQERERLAGGDA